MEYRPLDLTGVQVSPLFLGDAMMFGLWDNDDRDNSYGTHELAAHTRRRTRP